MKALMKMSGDKRGRLLRTALLSILGLCVLFVSAQMMLNRKSGSEWLFFKDLKGVTLYISYTPMMLDKSDECFADVACNKRVREEGEWALKFPQPLRAASITALYSAQIKERLLPALKAACSMCRTPSVSVLPLASTGPVGREIVDAHTQAGMMFISVNITVPEDVYPRIAVISVDVDRSDSQGEEAFWMGHPPILTIPLSWPEEKMRKKVRDFVIRTVPVPEQAPKL